MSHHLVRYTQHVRREFERVLEDVSEADCEKRVAGMNSIAWITGHLAGQEQSYWLESQGTDIIADLTAVRNGADLSQPSFSEMYRHWKTITEASNPYLEQLSDEDLRTHFSGRRFFEIENIGSLMTRVIGHYYFHIGQISAIRKILGYDVPSFVGSQEGAYFE